MRIKENLTRYIYLVYITYMQTTFNVKLNPKAKKQLAKIPLYIVDKLNSWIEAVNHDGIREIRKLSGYHDEPLSGNRLGQRSIRLSKSYRAIYIELDTGEIQFIEIIEVHKSLARNLQPNMQLNSDILPHNLFV